MRVAVVTGCPRSGTSIMGECLTFSASQPVLWFEPEELRGLPRDILAHRLRALHQSRRHVVKAPFLGVFTEEILHDVPDLAVVYMVRDWRDTVASIWEARQLEGQPMSLGQCMAHLQTHRRAVANLEDERFHVVRFEQLLARPRTTLQDLWSALGWRPGDTNAVVRRVTHTPGENEAWGQHRLAVPHRRRVGRWQELPEPQRSQLEEMEWAPPPMKRMP